MMSRDGYLVSLLLILSFSLSPALADRRRSKGLEYEVLRCIDECDNTDIREYLLCQRDCELKHGEHQAEEEQQYGRRRLDPRWQPRRGGKRIPERAPESEYERCLRTCESEGTGGRGREGGRWRRQCEDQCEELRRAQERKRDWEREREILVIDDRTSPRGSRERLERCLRRCERQRRGQQRQLCRFRCHHHQPQLRGEEVNYHEGEDDEMKSWGSGENPYYFHSRRFRSQFRTELGHMRVLENFSKRSELLKGIRNYRFAILEAGPRTVVVPHRTDADYVLFVLNGRGTIGLIQQEKRESYELERGDVIKVPAGTVSYLTSDGNQLIQIAKLVHPVNTPGSFQPHFLAGSEEPESYFWAFSSELLETAFRAPRDQLKRLLGQQGQGVIRRHRDEQLKGPNLLDNSSKQKKSSGSSYKSRGPFNLLNEQPIYSNKFGRFFQASPKETKQLQDLGISVTFAEVNQGAMMLPHYNSRTTALVFVQDGSGYFEMASPHLASERRGPRQAAEEQEETSGPYRRVAAHLSPGDFFVIPAGHPIAIVASRNENLRMVGFLINALNNQRNCLAGRGNMASQIDEEAKQLPFSAPAQEIDRVLDSQDRSYFVAAPPTDAEGRAVGSILDTAGLL